MLNELLVIASALVNIIFILFSARRGLIWLFSVVMLNLVLVSIFGAKLISVFGLVTNAGNVFYASAFFATHLIVEQYGRREGLKTIWFGAAFMVFFTVATQLAASFDGLPLSYAVDVALTDVFAFSLRVALASVLAYVFAQQVNIFLYDWLKVRTREKHMWLRTNVSNIIAQCVDSMLFFSIAFFSLPAPLLVQAILAGWLVKSAVVLLATPLLYVHLWLNREV